MPLQDFRSLELPSDFHADVCIVGSGPAGWTIAEELRNAGLQILVLESGGVAESGVPSPASREHPSLKTENVGEPLFNGRCRTLGGTPEAVPWGSRCVAFDEIDFEARDWVPHSGWPIGKSAVLPFLNRASMYLGAGPYLSAGPGAGALREGGVQPPNLAEDLLTQVWWHFGMEEKDTVRFGRLFRRNPAENVRVLINCTVTHINCHDSLQRVQSVEVTDGRGRTAEINARAFVLCAGGIENARILLYSNRQTSAGLGNLTDNVGRFLMDHPRDVNLAISFDRRDSNALHRLFGPLNLLAGGVRREYVGGVALSPSRQRNEGLLNCAAFPAFVPSVADPVAAAIAVKRKESSDKWRDIGIVARHPFAMTRAAYRKVINKQPIRHQCVETGMLIVSEQEPNPLSRVTLSSDTDWLGLPIARTDWRISAADRRSQIRLGELIQAEFKRLKLPEARLISWMAENRPADSQLVDGCHPTGTTRMSEDVQSGVVDANCQVHGIEGLYVAGSSIFPTAGHANPTLMIVAFAIRLAAHLRDRLKTNGDGPNSKLERAQIFISETADA